MTPEQTKALTQAALFIDALYQWVDKVDAAGGTTSIQGISVARSFLESLKKNKSRTFDLIVRPAREALEAKP